MQLTVSGRTFEFPRRCVCCGRPAELHEYERAWVFPLASLLTLATGEVSHIDEFRLRPRDAPRWPQEVLLLPQEPRSAVAARPHAEEPLFTRADLADGFSDVLRRWFQLAESKRRFFQLFFSLLVSPPAFVEVRFSMLSQALDLYARPATASDVIIGFPDVGATLGPKEALSRRIDLAKARLWEDERPASKEYFVLCGAIEWLLRLALLRDIGALTPRAAANRHFRHTGRQLA